MNGGDWFEYVQQNDQDIQKYTLVPGGNVQSKVFEQKKKILLSELARLEDSPISFKTVAHELGHAKNNSINPNLYKKYYLFERLWSFALLLNILFLLWHGIAEYSDTLLKIHVSLITIILLFLSFISYTLAKVKYNDECSADTEGKKLVCLHLKPSMDFYNDTRDPIQLQKNIEKVFNKDAVSFWKSGYTIRIFVLWMLILLSFLFFPLLPNFLEWLLKF